MALRLQRYHGESFWVGFRQPDRSMRLVRVDTVGGCGERAERTVVVRLVNQGKVTVAATVPSQQNGDLYLRPNGSTGDEVELIAGRASCRIWIDRVRGRQIAWAIDAPEEQVVVWRDEVLAQNAAAALANGSLTSLDLEQAADGQRQPSGNSSVRH